MNIELKSWLCFSGVMITIVAIQDTVKHTLNFDISPLLIGAFAGVYFIPLFRNHFKKTVVTDGISKEKEA